MTSILAALTWEFYRRVRFGAMLAVCSVTGITTLMAAGAYVTLDAETIRVMAAAMQNGFLWIELGVFILVVLAAQSGLSSEHSIESRNLSGFSPRLFTLPVRTSVLVGWAMCTGALTAAVLSLASTGLFWLVFRVSNFSYGIAVVAATATVVAQAVFWWTAGFYVFRFVSCFVLGISVPVLLAICYRESGMLQSRQICADLAASNVLLLVATFVAAYILSVVAVARDRRGDCHGWPQMQEWLSRQWSRLVTILPGSSLSFGSLEAAQFWFEWRQKGLTMPAIVVCFVLAVLGPSLAGFMDEKRAVEVFLSFGIALQCLPVIVAMHIGHTDPFTATLPASNAQLAGAVLRTGIATTLAAWAIWLVGFSVAMARLWMTPDSIVPAELLPRAVLRWMVGHWFFPTYVVASLLVGWSLLGIFSSVMLTGRAKWFSAVVMVAEALFIGGIIVNNSVPADLAATIRSASTCVIAVVCLTGTAWAYSAAQRRRLIEPHARRNAAATWIGFCLLATLLWLTAGLHTPDLPQVILVSGLLALPAAPFATAPLAVAWNRTK